MAGRRLRAALATVTLAALGATAGGAGAQAAGAGGLELRRIAAFQQPSYTGQAPGDPVTLYVAEQRGRIMAVRNGRTLPHPFLDIRGRVRFGPEETSSVEAGLFSFAFDPDYARNRRFYVIYTGPAGNNYIDRYRSSAGGAPRARPQTRTPVLTILHPFADSHNGGQLQFGPDGMLWASMGDGGCCGDVYDQSRNLGSLLGKLLRIDPLTRDQGYRVPAGNPLAESPGSEPIYSWGLRNVWRFSFDRLTGALVAPDVGDNEKAREEINYLSPAAALGANFGWPEYEGFRLRDPGRPGPGTPVPPIAAYAHRRGECAITGGYVVRDAGLPQLYGRYLYADFCGGWIRSLVPPPLTESGLAAGGQPLDVRDEGLRLDSPVSFGEGLAGEIYVVSRSGPVYRLRAKAPAAAG